MKLSKEHKAKISAALKGRMPKNINSIKEFWKGKKMPKELREKLSKAHKGKPLSIQHRNALSKAFVGHFVSEETKKKISQIHKKSGHMPPVKKGEASHMWKGNKVKYSGLHVWVRKNLGYPDKCEHCNKSGFGRRQIHWANKSQKYKRELSDWLRLCSSCHKIYDNKR